MDLQVIDHVAINVRELERSAEWYRRVLGFEIFNKWKSVWMIARGPMRIGMFQRPDATPVEDLDNKVALTHMAFLTTENGFAAAQTELARLGVPFEPPEDTGIAHSLFFSDPDGHSLEVTYYYKGLAEFTPPTAGNSCRPRVAR